MKALVDALEARLGKPVELIEVNGATPICAEKILVLLPCRGGHWRRLLNRIVVGRVVRLPPTVIATILARSARARGAKRLVLCYLKARRFREEQEEDIRAIIASLEGFGVEAVALGLDSMESPRKKTIVPLEGSAMAPLAIFPGKLAKTCYSASNGVPVGPLLVEGFDIVLEWAYNVARERYVGQSHHYVWAV